MMGDKLTQKMDSVMFAQERLKRQVDQLEDSVKVRNARRKERLI